MSAIYESDKLLSEYLLFHFGSDEEILPESQNWPAGMRDALGFPCRTAAHFSEGEAETALDLGCAVGRSAFEMARSCKHVTGMDFSNAFVQAAERLRRGESIPYERLEEAAETTPLQAQMPAGVDGARLEFQQADATALPQGLGPFDRVHAANLLCRLPDPERLLGRLPSLVKPGGELVLATPCTWLEEFTPRENWPVGTTFEWLQKKLSPAFNLLRQAEEPFLIRETARKFQWTTSMVTVWKQID